jgi:hypothetical protein
MPELAMIAIRLPSILFATALVVSAAAGAEARDGGASRGNMIIQHQRHVVDGNPWGRHRPPRPAHMASNDGLDRGGHHGRRSRDVYGNSISIIGGIGTYVGDIDVTRDRGNGIYFMRDSYGWGPQAPEQGPALAPRAKIIDVEQAMASGNAFAPRNACSYENGVCVIRGDR